MAGSAPEKSSFFARSNYAVRAEATRERAVVEKHSLAAATQGLLSLAEQAIGRIEQGVQSDAGLRELWASLLQLRGLCARDPGIRMAAQDLYEAAAAIVLHRAAGSGVVDIRLWRLLQQAKGRLRARLT